MNIIKTYLLIVQVIAFWYTPMNAQTNVSISLKDMVNERRHSNDSLTNSAHYSGVAPILQKTINTIISYTSSSVLSEAEALGAKVGTNNEAIRVATLLIPIDKLDEIACIKGMNYMDGNRVTPSMDLARNLNGAEGVHNAIDLPEGINGSGVVAGIIDIGFEYGHINFTASSRKDSLRYLAIWDQNSAPTENYVAPEGYDYGIYLDSLKQILETGYDQPGITKKETHGTHTSGVVAGSDYTSGYYGIAPGTDIILVSSLLTDACIIDGVRFIIDKAKQHEKPCVINISLGQLSGPNDGTSLAEQMLDMMAEEEGVAIVISAGNNGQEALHAQQTLTSAEDTLTLRFDPLYSSLSLKAWSPPATEIAYRFCLEEKNTGKIVYTTDFVKIKEATNKQFEVNLTDSIGHKFYFIFKGGINMLNGKGETSITFSGSPAPLKVYVRLQTIMDKPGTINFWCGKSQDRTLGTPTTGWDSNYSINSLATGFNTIAVGACLNHASYTNLNNLHIVTAEESKIGAMMYYSSKGPTTDGRIKPDIVSTGTNVISSFSKLALKLSNFSFTTVYKNDGNPYGVLSGTSISAPCVAGVIALWMQLDPTINHKRIKQLLIETAIRDNFTTDLAKQGDKSNLWGWGKIDAWEGSKRLVQLMASEKRMVHKIELSIRQTGLNRRTIETIAMQPIRLLKAKLYDMNGATIMQLQQNDMLQGETLLMEIPQSVAPGIYLLQTIANGKQHNTKIILK